MSANDADEFVTREIDWLAVPLRAGKPYLGLCLGAQMLARHLGQSVRRNPQGRAEIGYYPIEATEAGRSVCAAPFPEQVYQWHQEGFDLPRDAVLLATGQAFPNQAFRHGHNAFALQFHPEVTYSMICRWTTQSADRMDAPGAQPTQRHRDGWFQFDGAINRWIGAFLDHWLATKTRAPAICAV